ncbi:OmpP1/FadL family transporter [Neisseriaceae bacterium B1]
MKQKFVLKTIALLTTTVLAQNTFASGYHFGTQSVTAQSTANAAATEAADATTIFTNPAGLTHLKTHEVSATMNLVMPNIEYESMQAEHLNGRKVEKGSTSGKITPDAVIAPHIYGAYKVNDRITLGLGVYVPFASKTEYDRNSVLRYNLNELGLTTTAIQPTAAFKINDKHSIGLGLSMQYSKAKLRKYADWGLSAGKPGSMDGYAEVEGDDLGFGYQLGWLYDISPRARVGITYRSKVEHNLKGTAEWKSDVAPAPIRAGLEAAGFKAHEDASVKIVTPESLSVHGMFRATDKLNLFGDVTWTRHSRFNQANLQFQNPKPTANGMRSNTTTITPNWRNTFKVALGGSYQYSQPLQFRAGIAFDQSPVRSAQYRLNTLPDGNRIWFSAGIKYTFKQKHTIDAAYSHIHINDTTFNNAAATGKDVDSKGKSSASFRNYANIFGVQYTYKF